MRFSSLSPGGEADLTIEVVNAGSAASVGDATITDTLPAGVVALPEPQCSGTTVVTCVIPGPTEIHIPVRVEGDVASGSQGVNRLTISGGGSSPFAASLPVTFSAEPRPGFSSFAAWLTNADGSTDTQAGSHPYELMVSYGVNTRGHEPSYEEQVGGETRALNLNLPPGLVGDARAVPQCPRAQFDSLKECPASTRIGFDEANISGGLGRFYIAVYNLVPPRGLPAQFAFNFNGDEVFLNAGVRTGGDNGITTHVPDIPQEKVIANLTTIWGVPADHGTGAEAKPLLTLPTSCGAPLKFRIEQLGTWQHPEAPRIFSETELESSAGVPVGLTGCERLAHFEPTVGIAPDTSYTDTPAGLSVNLNVPQGVNPEGLATSGVENTRVTLPEGVVINPGQATGLVACQPSQEALGVNVAGEANEEAPSCPNASKVGTDSISTPLLPDKLEGNVYILGQNPPNLQLLVAASGDGVNLKLIGNVHLNEQTGQLTTTFEHTPDLPFTNFQLSFSGGAQAALATPITCGIYRSTADFSPWASPFVADALVESSFPLESGPNNSGRAACTGPLPFTPVMTAGATTDQAGGYTSFSMLLQRSDGQQRVKKLSFKAPEGLSGMIAKVPLCDEAQANTGTCPAASQIGHTVVGAGPGPYPLFIPQAGQSPAPIYLTEKYEGAPFGLSIVVPIVAGPFTLETKVVRAKIEIDLHTAQITVTTDPLPTIVSGIPADLRSINAVIDRPGFMFNPTDCNPASFSGTATSTEGVTVPISSPFQVGSCRALTFKPDFKVSTLGKTSRKDGASLEAKIVYPTTPLGANQASSQSNIASVKVDLPKQLPSRLTTLQKACTAAQFEANPAGCPAPSVVGHAKVITPILPVPLEGPAYFVSHGGEAFPSLIVVLQGYGVTVDLVGTTFISKAGITSSTFKSTPDVPFSSFDLTLPEGKYSALAANLPANAHSSFCGQKLTMPTAFIAQNGAVINQSTPIAITGCTKTKAAVLTRAQKLTKALKACRKKTKSKRAGCVRHARKEYGRSKK